MASRPRLRYIVATSYLCIGVAGTYPSTSIAQNPTLSAHQQAGKQEPVTYWNSWDGYEFEVPPGMTITVHPAGDHSWIALHRERHGLEDGFYVEKCSSPHHANCVPNNGDTLLWSADVRMAGHAAKEYAYRRRTAAATRIWTEVVSALTVKNETFTVMVKIPYREKEREYLSLYRRIRDSFRLTRP